MGCYNFIVFSLISPTLRLHPTGHTLIQEFIDGCFSSSSQWCSSGLRFNNSFACSGAADLCAVCVPLWKLIVNLSIAEEQQQKHEAFQFELGTFSFFAYGLQARSGRLDSFSCSQSLMDAGICAIIELHLLAETGHVDWH